MAENDTLEGRDEPHYLTDSEMKFLDYVGAYINAKKLSHNGETYHYRFTKPPKFDELTYSFHPDYIPREEDLESLTRRGFVHPTTIARRKIRWAPTQHGFDMIEQLYSSEFEHLLFARDPNGSFTHHQLTNLGFGRIYYADEIIGLEMVNNKIHKGYADARVDYAGDQYDFAIEAATVNNDTERINKKYHNFKDTANLHVAWLFPDREQAVKTVKRLSRKKNDIFFADKIGKPAQYPISKLNKQLWHMQQQGSAQGIRFVQTLTGTLQTDYETWLRQYYQELP